MEIFYDGLFAAIAAIGFAAISRPPLRAFPFCALIAAVGHSARFILMSPLADVHIVPATLTASFLIGLIAVAAAPLSRIPPETYLFPALLPMIPGIYAYKAFAGLAMCILSDSQPQFLHNFYLFGFNAMMCCGLLLCMVVGAVTPIFLFKRISFQSTRPER